MENTTDNRSLNSICRAISSGAIHRQHVSARRADQLAVSTISSLNLLPRSRAISRPSKLE
jgi:hypothetical protein